MKINKEDPYVKFSLFTIITIGILYIFKTIIDCFGSLVESFIFLFSHIIKLFSPFIWGLILSYLINPIVEFFQKKLSKFYFLKKKDKEFLRFLSVLITYLMVVLILFLGIYFVIPQLVQNYRKLVKRMPYFMAKIEEFQIRFNIANAQVYYSNIPEQWKVKIFEGINAIKDITSNMLMEIGNTAIQFTYSLLTVVLAPFISFYILKDLEYFKAGYKRMEKVILPMDYRVKLQRFLYDIHEVLSNFIRGQLIVALVVGVLSFLAMWILKVDFAILIGIIAGIMNIIPYFGPIIGTIPAVVLTLISGNLMKALWVVIIFFVIQEIESVIIAPKIVGNKVGLHPVFVIFSIVLGGTYFGLLGMIVAVPIAAILKLLFERIIADKEEEMVDEI